MIPRQLVTTRCHRQEETTAITQGDSEGKANILQGDSIGHREKNSSYENVSHSEW